MLQINTKNCWKKFNISFKTPSNIKNMVQDFNVQKNTHPHMYVGGVGGLWITLCLVNTYSSMSIDV